MTDDSKNSTTETVTVDELTRKMGGWGQNKQYCPYCQPVCPYCGRPHGEYERPWRQQGHPYWKWEPWNSPRYYVSTNASNTAYC